MLDCLFIYLFISPLIKSRNKIPICSGKDHIWSQTRTYTMVINQERMPIEILKHMKQAITAYANIILAY